MHFRLVVVSTRSLTLHKLACIVQLEIIEYLHNSHSFTPYLEASDERCSQFKALATCKTGLALNNTPLYLLILLHALFLILYIFHSSLDRL
jgi:hypothetical protein